MFDRRELDAILRVYGRMVAAGEWRDYAIDAMKEQAVFSVYRRTSEHPLYRIVKTPADARRQGAWQILAPGGTILKRGQEIASLLAFFDRRRFRVVE
ncbi:MULTISPECIES: DUF2794 domain-containing protein [Hyphobacterium]|uniref:DUF2794 domain-containing protein n=1 Tax=Hyphobacterium vulgare TaxID=1736751 RepID=A0ABV6ZWV7_9PROT